MRMEARNRLSLDFLPLADQHLDSTLAADHYELRALVTDRTGEQASEVSSFEPGTVTAAGREPQRDSRLPGGWRGISLTQGRPLDCRKSVLRGAAVSSSGEPLTIELPGPHVGELVCEVIGRIRSTSLKPLKRATLRA